MALLKQCPRCKKFIPYGQTYCAQCAPIMEAKRQAYLEAKRRESNRRYNKKRDPKYAQFYRSKEWRRLAARRLQLDNYTCRTCGHTAAEVDHIIPIQTPKGWTHRLDIDNTQSLCIECHNKKHKRFMKKDKQRDTLKRL